MSVCRRLSISTSSCPSSRSRVIVFQPESRKWANHVGVGCSTMLSMRIEKNVGCLGTQTIGRGSRTRRCATCTLRENSHLGRKAEKAERQRPIGNSRWRSDGSRQFPLFYQRGVLIGFCLFCVPLFCQGVNSPLSRGYLSTERARLTTSMTTTTVWTSGTLGSLCSVGNTVRARHAPRIGFPSITRANFRTAELRDRGLLR